jgi:hypothetical protein
VVPDLCALVRRDHDDLDRALAAMVDAATPVDELAPLLDVFELALAVHVAAEAKVFDTLVAAVPAPPILQLVAAQARDDHAAQQLAADALHAARPGSDDWYARALDLRVLVVEQATRGDLERWTLQDHVPLALGRALAREYATERMRMLARSSPALLARARLAEGYGQLRAR